MLGNAIRRSPFLVAATVLFSGLLLQAVVPMSADAALLSNRKLTLSSSAKGDISLDANGTDVCALTTFAAPQGGCGAKAKHTVNFTMATSGATTGAIIIMYCTSPIFQSTCDTPGGDAASEKLSAENLTSVTVSGLNATSNFTIDTVTTNGTINSNPNIDANGQCNDGVAAGSRGNCVVMKRGSAQVETGTPAATIAYGGGTTDYIKNPVPDGNENYTFYARVLVLDGTDLSSANVVDYGGLAASTAQQVDILAKVQEILRFSVGTTQTAKVSNAACTPYNDTGALTLGETGTDVLSPNQAYDDFSWFRINTNTVNGTVVAYSGETLVSGTNDINEIGPAGDISRVGTEQFGLGIDSTGTDHEFVSLTAQAPYNAANGTITDLGTASFAFDDASMTAPITVATSTGGITCDTGAVRYIANISTSTPAGIYRTTITYIATGTY